MCLSHSTSFPLLLSVTKRHKHRQISTLIKHLLLPAGKKERCYCYDFVNYLGGVRHCGERQQYNQNLDRHPGINSQREHWITADATGTLNPHLYCGGMNFQHCSSLTQLYWRDNAGTLLPPIQPPQNNTDIFPLRRLT